MLVAVFVVVSIILALLLAVTLNAFRAQHSTLVSVMHLISNFAQGQYGRRADPWARGAAGELARVANTLGDDLEARAARAQQDKDHLLSLLAVLGHTNEIAVATDNMDTVRLANPAAAQVLERPADEIIGKHIDTVVHHPDLRALYKSAFSSDRPVSAQVALQIPGRSLHCKVTAATIYNGPHYRGTLLVLRDITEVARALQMKTDFATNASHELRTPLASIRAAVETIKDAGVEDHETTRRCVEIINNHVLRLQLMVQDLMDLSRAEDSRSLVRSDAIDLQLVCDAMAASYTSQLAEKKLQLHVDLAPDARTFRGDERLLTLTLKNLIDNAIKFTPAPPPVGRITVKAYRQIVQPPAINGHALDAPAARDPSAAPAVDSFVLEVSDTGVGIPPEEQERVFERFYTVNRSRGGSDRGTGLGLSIVKHAVNAMHGSVSLSSEVHKGTTLRCVFPLQAPGSGPQ